MKSTSQTVVLLGVLIGVVFVVTFVSQWVSSGDTPKKKAVVASVDEVNAKRLEFPETAANESFLVEMHPEIGGHDFWFKNPHDVPIEVSLESKSCKCARVEMTTLSTEEEREHRTGARYGASQMLAVPQGPLTMLATSALAANRLAFGLPSPRWVTVEDAAPGKEHPVVPPRGTGFVRVGWDGKEAKPQRLKAALFTNAKGDEARGLTTLEVAVQFVPTFVLNTTSLDLSSPIRQGKSASGSFYCWSYTRAGFSLQVEPKDNDPCYECETIAINPEDVQHLAGKDAPPIRTAYRVKVTVHSERAGRTLDMGPFAHRIEVSSPQTVWTSVVMVSGTVEGSIRVVSEGGKDLVNLEDFRASIGKRKSVVLEADGDANLEIEPKATFPNYLKVDLERAPAGANERKQWKLTVAVPPDRADGRMPPESGVTLRTTEQPPRRIRIPVRGHASSQ